MNDEARRDTMVVAMARHVPDGTLCVQGLSTPLATAALMLAKATHAPDAVILYTDGGVISDAAHPVTLLDATRHALDGASRAYGFQELIFELVPTYSPLELMRPAQLDERGNSNNVLIQGDGKLIPLPGSAGIGDATSANWNLSYYLPRHDRRTLVPQVDFVSAPGRDAAEAEATGLPRVPVKVFTELCVFGYEREGPRLLSLYPGVTVEEVAQRTGFAFQQQGRTPALTAEPTQEELTALEAIDPHRLRDLEFLQGTERLGKLKELVQQGEADTR
jgi:glutaconate CoA-transferase, subunit B